MAPPPSSTATLVNRLFTISMLVLTLYTVYQGYLVFIEYGKMRRENNYYKTENFYKTVVDSIRRTLPVAHRAAPVIVYRTTAPSTQATQVMAATIANRIRLDMQRELRATAERLLAGQHAGLRPAQAKAVVALKDTTIRRRSPATGRLVATTAKTGTYRDPWLSLTGVIIPGQPGRQDSLQVKYLMKVEFSAQAYSKRTAKHWWQWWEGRRAYVDLKTSNPNTSTTKMEGLKIQKR